MCDTIQSAFYFNWGKIEGIAYLNHKCDLFVLVVLELKCGLMHYHVAVYCLFSTTAFAGVGDVTENVIY